MSAELQTALLLLVVGMITVFIILSLVVLTGRTLIWVVNNYFSPEEKLAYDYNSRALQLSLTGHSPHKGFLGLHIYLPISITA